MIEKIIPITRRDVARRMREMLREGREHRRDITLMAKSDNDTACLDASGAINLTINDFLPTVDNSLGLPPGLEIETGVSGNNVHPVSIDDVDIEEEGETAELTDQSLGFASVYTNTPVCSGITVEVSNRAIDAAGFDLLGYIQSKFQIAQRRYIVSHLLSNAHWDGNCGPFSSANAPRWSVAEGSLYESIKTQMLALEEAGYDTREACIVMDFEMEKRLKYSPIVEGEGRMMIEGGLCCGYQYIANNYFNTQMGADGKLVKSGDDAIGIAVFKWFKVVQHDKARLIIDGVSNDVARRGVTSITLNADWSFTDLSEKINGGAVRAFHTLVMERGYLADVGDHVFRTSDGYLLTVGMSRYRMNLADSDNRILTADGEVLTVEL